MDKGDFQHRDPAQILFSAADTLAARSRDYANGGRNGNEVHAEVLRALFPEGIPTGNAGSLNKFVLLNFIIGKVVRYALLLDKGGHQDSAHDIAVYGAILDSYHKDPITCEF